MHLYLAQQPLEGPGEPPASDCRTAVAIRPRQKQLRVTLRFKPNLSVLTCVLEGQGC
jgi:hypothetical protein